MMPFRMRNIKEFSALDIWALSLLLGSLGTFAGLVILTGFYKVLA